MPVIMVVEDDRATRETLVTALKVFEMDVISASSGEEALDRLRLAPVDVVISDVMMRRVSGVELLEELQRDHPDTAVILVTAFGTIKQAVDSMRKGAFDYLTKPINLDRLVLLVQRACGRLALKRENRDLKEQLRRRFSVSGIIGQSEAMRGILHQIEQVAPTNASVLIRGESGTGKELVASAIHHHSLRVDGPMIKVNCVAFAEGVIESELFGHERGAFTGAHRSRQGRFQAAHKGTLFLDEVGDLSVPTQLKLLRAIQEREIERVGSQTPINVDVRLLAATNRDLEQAMQDGDFREELYYRLKVVTLTIPPIRERPVDIQPLLNFFLNQFCSEYDKTINGFTPGALERLCSYRWPGNVRELRNSVESLVVTQRGDEIRQRDLPASLAPENNATAVTIPLGHTMEAVERRYVLRTLEALGGNKVRTAQVLGISKKTLYRRLHEWSVTSEA